MTKKLIKRNLAIQGYKMVDSFCDGCYCQCENCGQVIKNVAIVQGDNGGRDINACKTEVIRLYNDVACKDGAILLADA